MLVAAFLLQATIASMSEKPHASDYQRCTIAAASDFAASQERAETVVEAALAKCRFAMERYLMDAPAGSLAAAPGASDQIRRTMVDMARESALVRVLEIRSKK